MRQHEHDKNEHEFDHQQKKAGLHHAIIQGKKQLALHQQDLRDTNTETLVLTREFHKLSNIHQIWHDDIPGFEIETFPIHSQIDNANHYRLGMVTAIIVAVIFGVYFSTTTLIADSFWLLFAATTVVAAVIGVIASVVLKDFLHAHPVNPKAAKSIRIALVISGAAFFAQLLFFAWIRLQSDSIYAEYLPAVMVGLEFAAVLCAATCEVGSRFYRWSENLHEKHRALVAHRHALNDEIRHETESLEGLEARLHEHESIEGHNPEHEDEHHHKPSNQNGHENSKKPNHEVNHDPHFEPISNHV